MPILIASLALLIAAASMLIATIVVIVGWLRQDRAIRRMQRDTAERTARSGSSR